jgi:hypothetical protein
VAEITVSPVAAGRFHVTVRAADSSTEHDVTLSGSDLERLGPGYASPEDLVRACFEFLLEREPKESILSSFDVGVIERYFPEFEIAIRRP